MPTDFHHWVIWLERSSLERKSLIAWGEAMSRPLAIGGGGWKWGGDRKFLPGRTFRNSFSLLSGRTGVSSYWIYWRKWNPKEARGCCCSQGTDGSTSEKGKLLRRDFSNMATHSLSTSSTLIHPQAPPVQEDGHVLWSWSFSVILAPVDRVGRSGYFGLHGELHLAHTIQERSFHTASHPEIGWVGRVRG